MTSGYLPSTVGGGDLVAELDPRLLVVADGSAEAGEDIVRVRRKAHGVADWIHSPTCRVRIVLRPAGLHTAGLHTPGQAAGTPGPSAADPVAPVPPAEPSAEAAAVRDALAEVIDPDLGVNIVDLGFVRDVALDGRTAVITMTLTSAACPLTGVLEDQIRAGLVPLGCVDDFRSMAVDTGLAARRHHRQRPRTAARHRLHHLIQDLRVARPR